MNYKLQKIALRATPLTAVRLCLLAALGISFAQPAAAQTTDEIIAKVLAARGGLEKAKAVQSERITGTIYFSPELYGPFIAEFKRPGKMHNELTIHNKTVVRTFNGKDGGWVINPFVGKNSAEPLSADDLKDVRNESDFDGPLVDAEVKGIAIELTGTEKIDGKDAYILKVTHRDGQVSSYSFDAKTFLLVKWSGIDKVKGEPVTRETFFHDYRDVGGLKFAFELVSNDPGAEVTQRIIVDKIELDPQIDDSRFEKPAAPPSEEPSAASPQAAEASSNQQINASQRDAKNEGGTGRQRSTSLR